jgi:hypothetical protein
MEKPFFVVMRESMVGQLALLPITVKWLKAKKEKCNLAV